METSDLTVQILTAIRDEIRGTNRRLETVESRLEHIEHTMLARDAQLSTELVGLATTTRNIHTLMQTRVDLRHRVESCERDIAELKRRVG